MPETTVTITELLAKPSERAPHAAKDSNGTIYKRWDEPFQLGAFKFEYEDQTSTKDGRTFHSKFVNPDTIQAVNGSSSNGETPVAGTGDYVKGKTNPADEKAINARRAMQDAVAAMTHTIPSGATPKDAWDKIGPLYQKIKLELNLESGFKNPGPDYDKDIPF